MVRKEFMLPDMDSTFRVFAAHWRTVEADWSYPLHKHPLFEVNLVLSGTQEMVVNRSVYVQRPGDLMLLNPGYQHESRALGEEEMTYYCLHFDVDERALRELLLRSDSCFYASDSSLAQTIRPSLDKLIALTSEASHLDIKLRMSVLSALFELFSGISGTLSNQGGGGAPSRMSATAAQVAALLEQAVESGYHEDGSAELDTEASMQTIETIAAAVGYSTSSVNRMFTRVYGVSPRQYMSTLMLKKAKLLLMDPNLTVEAVSERLGYRNIAHFSRQFKRWTGEPPSRFRERFH